MSMEDAEQQGAAPAPEARNEAAPPEAPSGASQQERQLTKEELEPPTGPPTPPQPQARPQFSSRSVAPNEFQIFNGETPLGKRLTPSESAIVLAWAKSIDDSEA